MFDSYDDAGSTVIPIHERAGLVQVDPPAGISAEEIGKWLFIDDPEEVEEVMIGHHYDRDLKAGLVYAYEPVQKGVWLFAFEGTAESFHAYTDPRGQYWKMAEMLLKAELNPFSFLHLDCEVAH